jgi:hypothetical protein
LDNPMGFSRKTTGKLMRQPSNHDMESRISGTSANCYWNSCSPKICSRWIIFLWTNESNTSTVSCEN